MMSPVSFLFTVVSVNCTLSENSEQYISLHNKKKITLWCEYKTELNFLALKAIILLSYYACL